MPKIKEDVQADHLRQFPTELSVLTAFLPIFDVTWAKRRRAHNTELSVYFLAPETEIRIQFGLEFEVMLAICDYPTVEARTIQAIEQIIQDVPARGRVEQTTLFLVSDDAQVQQWVENYASLNPQSRIPIAFSTKELRSNVNDKWYVRNSMMKQLYSRDLFKEKLPIVNDLFFFGRDQIVSEFTGAIRQSENRGLFGLRKTGKTSVLFKVQRLLQQEGGAALYFDCKSPSIRNLHWKDFLLRIIRELESLDSRQGEFSRR